MVSKDIQQAFEERKVLLPKWLNEHPLRQIQWEATRRCDMECMHCGSGCTLSEINSELTEEEVIRSFESIAYHFDPARIELVSITGGEPLLRSDLPNIIRELKNLGFSHITVQTNGNRLNDDPNLLNSLINAGLSGLGINIDGLSKSHDKLRCRVGHFDDMCRLARRVIDESPLYLTITTVVSKLNIDDLSYLATRLSSMGVPRWRLIELQRMGRAHKIGFMHLDSDEFKRLIDFVEDHNVQQAQLKDSSLSVELACTGWFGRELEGIIRPYIWHCHAGVSTLGIWSNGDIGGCTDIDHSRSEGNVRTDSIPDVWENRFTSYRDWENRRIGKCRSCDQWSWCHGGAFHLRTKDNILSHCPFLLLNDGNQEET